jgi:hypothetical protein
MFKVSEPSTPCTMKRPAGLSDLWSFSGLSSFSGCSGFSGFSGFSTLSTLGGGAAAGESHRGGAPVFWPASAVGTQPATAKPMARLRSRTFGSMREKPTRIGAAARLDVALGLR